MVSQIQVRIRYPPGKEERARRIATLFKHPQVVVELVPGEVDEFVVEGPVFATTDLTLATALVQRLLYARNGKTGGRA